MPARLAGLLAVLLPFGASTPPAAPAPTSAPAASAAPLPVMLAKEEGSCDADGLDGERDSLGGRPAPEPWWLASSTSSRCRPNQPGPTGHC